MSPGTPGPREGPTPGSEVREPRIGDTIGSYRLVRLLGEGATGRVFEVSHLTIGRRAAMKILAPEHAARPGAVKRLFREAQAVNKIDHPRIVTVTDVIEADRPEGVNAIVMELLEGQSLGQAMAGDRAMSAQRYLPILAQVADALAAAHGARFVHRDLKPENIFLTTHHGRRDQVKLLDFGLAKTVAETATDLDGVTAVFRPSALGPRWQHATAEGTFVGTPAYVSPEQAAGKPLDHRTDIYSLGVILYELLCGRLPFQGRNFGEYVVKHLTEPPPPAPPEVLSTPLGRTLDEVARRCLSKDPAGRFGSAAELRQLFDSLATQELAIPTPPAPRMGGRRSLAIAAAVVAAVAGAGMILERGRRAQSGPAPAPSAGRTSASRGPLVVPIAPEQTVVLQFTSDPPAAQIYRVGHQDLLGLTPFSLEVQATGAAVEYEMRLPGHVPRRDRVVLAPDPPARTVGGRLRRLPDPRPARRAQGPEPARGKPNRNGTLNPFGR